MHKLDEIVLVTQMTKALAGLSFDELICQRFRNAAYVRSDAWSSLNFMPAYEFNEFDRMALNTERMRRSLFPVPVAKAA